MSLQPWNTCSGVRIMDHVAAIAPPTPPSTSGIYWRLQLTAPTHSFSLDSFPLRSCHLHSMAAQPAPQLVFNGPVILVSTAEGAHALGMSNVLRDFLHAQPQPPAAGAPVNLIPAAGEGEPRENPAANADRGGARPPVVDQDRIEANQNNNRRPQPASPVASARSGQGQQSARKESTRTTSSRSRRAVRCIYNGRSPSSFLRLTHSRLLLVPVLSFSLAIRLREVVRSRHRARHGWSSGTKHYSTTVRDCTMWRLDLELTTYASGRQVARTTSGRRRLQRHLQGERDDLSCMFAMSLRLVQDANQS